MKTGVFGLMLACLLPATLWAQETAVITPSLERLRWLAGDWRMERAGRIVDEHWMAPAGGVMLGMSRTVAKGKVVEHEFTQIREGPGGELFFVALPSRQKEAAFKALSQTPEWPRLARAGTVSLGLGLAGAALTVVLAEP